MSRHNRPDDKDINCIFCFIVTTPSPKDQRSRWLSKFRALYNELGEWDKPKLSGVGDRCIDDAVPVDAKKCRGEYGSAPSSDLRLIAPYPHDNPESDYAGYSIHPVRTAWGYFGHASCWELFQAVCTPYEIYLDGLNSLCRSSPSSLYALDLGIQSGPVPCRYELKLGREYGEEPLIDWDCTFEVMNQPANAEIYNADPLRIGLAQLDPCHTPRARKSQRQQDLVTYSFGIPSFLKGSGLARVQQVLANTQKDCFSGLPEELRLIILEFLSSPDVLNAKIASISLAYTVLSSPFWESRFSAGHELQCIFERTRQPMRVQDWRALFKNSKTLIRTPAFKNRNRIWKALLQLRDILSKMSHCDLHGEKLATFWDRCNEQGPQIKRIASSNAHFSKVSKDRPLFMDFNDSATLFEGSIVLYSNRATIPRYFDGLAATLIHHRGCTFITGLTFKSTKGGYYHIGYVNPSDHISLDFQGHTPAGFRVSACELGICGITIVFTTGSYSTALGTMGTLPRIELLFASKTESIDILCDFDGLKMLTFGTNTSDGASKGPKIRGRRSYCRDDYLWSPDIPNDQYSLSEPRVPKRKRLEEPSGGHSPRVYCMFGGKEGELLRKITKFSVWFLNAVVVGIEFHYGETSTILGRRVPLRPLESVYSSPFGSRESWHVEHNLDGPGGERMIDFHVSNQSTLSRLKIRTSLGREITIPPIGARPHRFPFPDNSGTIAIQYPDSTTILGLYSDLDMYCGLGVLGVISKSLGLAR